MRTTKTAHGFLIGWGRKAYECKIVGKMGPEENDSKAMKVLNRVLTWTDAGIELEADQRHAEIVAEMLGLKRGNGVDQSGTEAERGRGG